MDLVLDRKVGERSGARRRLGDRRSTAIASNTLDDIERHRHTAERAAVLEGSLTLFREAGHQRGTAYTPSSLGLLALGDGDLGHALALYEENLSPYEWSGAALGQQRMPRLSFEFPPYTRVSLGVLETLAPPSGLNQCSASRAMDAGTVWGPSNSR